MKRNKRAPVFVLVLALMLLLSVQAAADFGATASLTVGCPYAGSRFELYAVALETAEGELRLTEAFRNAPVDREGLLSEPESHHARTLESYVRLWGYAPVAAESIGESGTLRFSELDGGLYLLCSPGIRAEGALYKAQPLLVKLPMSGANGEPVYDGEAVPKVECVKEPGDEPVVSHKVLKVWKDEGREAFRPDSVSVHLLCDGALYETVTLSEENNWCYEWPELDAGCLWTVAEEPAADYTVCLEQEGTTFVLTNTCTAEPLPEVRDPALPQTGMLWWPVPVLGFGGVVLLALGRAIRRRENDEA